MQEIIRLDLGGVNAYLLPVQDSFILVDTGGWTFMDRPMNNRWGILEQKMIEHGCTPGKLKWVILTHGDVDHIANCRAVQQQYGAKIIIHKADADLLHNLTIEKVFSNFKFSAPGLKLMAAVMHPLFVKITKKIIAEYIEFDEDERIDENFELKSIGLDATIVHLPGHTKGSIGLVFTNGDIIAGDTLANTKKPALSMNAYDFKLLRQSVQGLKEKNLNMVYPGHGDPFLFSDLPI